MLKRMLTSPIGCLQHLSERMVRSLIVPAHRIHSFDRGVSLRLISGDNPS
jgi:hypothetical protein